MGYYGKYQVRFLLLLLINMYRVAFISYVWHFIYLAFREAGMGAGSAGGAVTLFSRQEIRIERIK